MRAFLTVVVLSLLVLSAGCGARNSPSEKPQSQAGQSEMQAQINPELAEKVKDAANTVKGVSDSTAIVAGKEISAAIKVKGFDRFRLKQIREEVHKKIKELYKDYEVNVTSDKKLFSQIQGMEKQIRDQKVQSPADVLKRLKKINKDMQG